jgi:hypothetical protein
MSESETPVASPLPSLIHGVEEAACTALGIGRLRHRSALHSLIVTDDIDLARLVHTVIASNWLACNADANRNRSRQNWRWELQSQISPANRSPEVVLERALAMAGKSGGSSDWANQIPVASGLVAGATDGRRAIDLGLRSGERVYELIELKIASDTPLYAAVELLGYASLLLLARRNPPNNKPELLNAERIDLRVLAPAAFYAPFDLVALERSVDRGVQSLGHDEGIELSFRFDVLPDSLSGPPLPEGAEILRLMGGRVSLHCDG